MIIHGISILKIKILGISSKESQLLIKTVFIIIIELLYFIR